MTRESVHRIAIGLAALTLVALTLSGCALLRRNRAPVAAFTATPDGGYAPLDVAFDASDSLDPDGDPLTYAWSFGDGTSGSGVAAAHTYAHAGTYEAILRVTDPGGLEGAALLPIGVSEVPQDHVALRLGWIWDGREQRLDFAVPWNLYQVYRGRLRTPLVDNYEYGAFVEDPLDDPTLEDLAQLLWDRAAGDEVAFAEYALAFTQGAIAYLADPPDVEWPLYPIETLVDGEGDCEDTAILYVSLLRARAVSTLLAFVDTDGDGLPDHVLALVAVPGSFAQRPGVTVIGQDDKWYAVAETSSGTLGLGIDPWGLEAEDLIRVWGF